MRYNNFPILGHLDNMDAEFQHNLNPNCKSMSDMMTNHNCHYNLNNYQPLGSFCTYTIDDCFETKPFLASAYGYTTTGNGGEGSATEVMPLNSLSMGSIVDEQYYRFPELMNFHTTSEPFINHLGIQNESWNMKVDNSGHLSNVNNNFQHFPSSSTLLNMSPEKITGTTTKGQWTGHEDGMLTHLVKKYGEKKWSQIALMLKGRNGKQCRERWHNHLKPNIKKDEWSEEEDRVLIEAHSQIGNKWSEIAKRLSGRTENAIKNHWNATKRRQFSHRRCSRSKHPRRSSLLQDYIKSLDLATINAGCRKKSTIITPKTAGRATATASGERCAATSRSRNINVVDLGHGKVIKEVIDETWINGSMQDEFDFSEIGSFFL